MAFLLVIMLSSVCLQAQTVIDMQKSGGVHYIPCEVNGLRLQFIFDTGASNVSISMAEALFMLKNGYLKESDIKGTNRYLTASGSIEEGTSLVLREIKIGNQYLYNVEASIVNSMEAPLLLGQSALSKLGNISVDYSKNQLIIGKSSGSQSPSSAYTPSSKTESHDGRSVKIGSQVWMVENLNVDRFRNGDLIPHASTTEEWKKAGDEKKPAWCYYDNDRNNGSKYGRLYNWYAVNDPRGLVPKGWHVPTDTEWTVLTNYLGGQGVGDKMKSSQYWQSPNYTVNQSGFSNLPGGARQDNGDFGVIGEYGNLWSSTEDDTIHAWYRYMWHKNSNVVRRSGLKGSGLSVRCLRD